MSTSRHEWIAFQRIEDGDQYVHVCNMQFRDGGGAKWPSLAIFGLPIGAGKDGLPTPTEITAATKIEKALRASMEKAEHGVHISTVTGAGGRMWIFQCKSSRATDLRFAKLPAKLRAVVSCQHVDDPRWTLYQESLLPNEREEMEYQNAGVLRHLAEAGDNPRRARPIEHLAYFPTEGARKKFVAWAKKESYKIDSTPEAAADQELPYSVFFSAKAKADLDLITEQTFSVMQHARKLKGFYDGWQTEPVLAK